MTPVLELDAEEDLVLVADDCAEDVVLLTVVDAQCVKVLLLFATLSLLIVSFVYSLWEEGDELYTS